MKNIKFIGLFVLMFAASAGRTDQLQRLVNQLNGTHAHALQTKLELIKTEHEELRKSTIFSLHDALMFRNNCSKVVNILSDTSANFIDSKILQPYKNFFTHELKQLNRKLKFVLYGSIVASGALIAAHACYFGFETSTAAIISSIFCSTIIGRQFASVVIH